MGKDELVICLLGRPGSGKGTQAKLIVEKFGLAYFGSGQILRERQQINDYTGNKLREKMSNGQLVPSFIASKLWADKMEEFKQESDLKGFILDGSPRTLSEAKLLDEALDWYQWQIDRVFLIDISKELSFNRLAKRRQCLKCGRLTPFEEKYNDIKVCDVCGGKLVVRMDDKPEAVKKRLDTYDIEMQPIIDFYIHQDKLIKINGEQSIEKVFQEIMENIPKE
ncbi:MAG: nucleoside monophosphate kinase [Candidatus Pacebacteria bacterium]|nr:nucleoside monophosphate kinase [Candidatus Paceibacterota bacterium]MDD4830771.1 nucleoside monophosphate kinase [Candidatus Paceibacterota bacterium]MDD4875307.1 nucleoside monophosphate kinase [Candidatus Paceibacterota bacterium]